MKNLIANLRNLALRSLFGALFLPAAVYASADLSIPTHSHDPAQPPSNSYITYSFTIHNNSATDAATNVTVTVSSTGSEFFDSGSPYFFFNNGDGTFTAAIGTIAAGADVPFTVKWFAQTGPVSVTATVASPDDSNPDNNSATESTTAGSTTPTADLQMVSVTVVPNPGKVGDLRHYHGNVTNNGPDDATDVQVVIQADSIDGGGFGYDFYETFDHSIPAPNPPDPDANGFRYLPLGDIPAHQVVYFDAYYNAVEEGSFSRNFFLALSGEQTDPNLDNNHFLIASTIDGEGSPTVDLSVNIPTPHTTAVGGSISYPFHVYNAGPDTATGVTVSFKPAANERLISATVPYTYEPTGPSAGYYFVTTPDLPKGVSSDFTFVFEPLQAGAVTLSGDVYSDVQDSNPGNDTFSVTGTVTPQIPPVHGGLSATTFTVNGSSTASTGLADTTLLFAAAQTGNAAGIYVRVQYNSVPGHPDSSWLDLDNGDHGFMIYDAATKQWVLSSLNYPAVNGVAFRAVASAPAYFPDSYSNQVGSFNLASTKPRLTPPILNVTGNGPFADLYFRAVLNAATTGATLRVQRSSTPYQELTWVDVPNGQMLVSNDATRYYLLANNLAAGASVYFRVLESKTGFADGISKASGPFNLTSDIPPKITSLTVSKALSGSGTSQLDPILVSAGSFTISASATPGLGGHSIAVLSLLYDGATINHVANGSISQTYTTTVIGDHLVEAVAADELGGTSRFGTVPTYIRVIPAATTVHAEKSGSSNSAADTASGKVFTLVTTNGLWSSSSSWKDAQGNSGVPGPNDLAAIKNAMTVKLGQNTTVRSISLDGQIYNTKDIPAPQFTLTVTGTMTVSTHGADILNVHLVVDTGATCEFFNNDVDCFVTGSVENDGKFILHGSKGIVGLQAFVNNGTSNFQVPTAIPADAGKNPDSDNRVISAVAVPTGGVILGALDRHFLADGSALISENGNGLISQDGNSFKGGVKVVSHDGGTLVNTNGSNIVGENGSGVISNDGGTIVAQGGGNIVAQGGGNAPQGQGVQADTTPTGFIQTGGETNLDGLNIIGPVTLNGGVLAGSGVIYGDLTNNSGYIAPGHSPGILGVTGNFTQGPNGTMVMEDGGATPDQFDQLQVAGKATLGGKLDIKLINGYVPDKADTFSPLSFTSHGGSFATVSSNGTATVNATGILTTVDPAKPAPKGGQTVNISTRAQVQTGDDVVIGGFIVTGPAGSTKKVVLRGIGPSLSSAGVAGALADPYLELYSGPTQLKFNDNWKSNKAAVEATGVAPKNDLESAIVDTLSPGAYTVVLHGAHGETGVGLVEIYDLDSSSPAALVNISTRCKVETDEDVMIGGFILQGGEPADVLVRAIGPSLASASVSGVLADPVLELHDANGAVITNNDWRESQEGDIIATTIPPTNERESAIRVTLPPGPYTAIVRGNNGGTGVALVEVYNLN